MDKSKQSHGQQARLFKRRSPSHEDQKQTTKRAASDLTRIVAVSGQTIEFQCPLASELLAGESANSVSRHEIIWRKDHQRLNQMNSTRIRLNQTNSSSTLTIVQAQPRFDESTYECALVDSSSLIRQIDAEPQDRKSSSSSVTKQDEKVHRFELKLLVPPRLAPFEFPRDVQVGMKVLLTCSALEGQQPISFVWLKDNQIIMPNAQQNAQQQQQQSDSNGPQNGEPLTKMPLSLAQFHQQQLADRFAISAHAAISLGQKSEYVLIRNAATKRQEVGIGANLENQLTNGDDDILDSPSTAETAQQSRNALDRHVSVSSMQLLDSSVKIRQADDYSILAIDSIELKHSGRYTCSAQNEAARVSHSSQLVINAPPLLTTEPKDIDSVSGRPVVIECAASGQPRPVLSWSKARESNGGKQLDLVQIYDNLRYSILPNGSLSIANVSQREQGYYMCSAKNGFGPEATKLTKLTVHEPARVVARYKTIESRIEERAQLTCEASGEQPISLVWLDKDGKQIDQKSTDKRFIVDNEHVKSSNENTATSKPSKEEQNSTTMIESSLFITRSIRSDSGHYTCQATNKFGQDKMVINLLIQDMPDKLTDLKVTNVTSSTISLRWQLGFNGNAPVTSYLVQYQSDDPLDDLLLMSNSAIGQQAATPRPSQQANSGPPADFLSELLTTSDGGASNAQEQADKQQQSTSSLKAALEMLNSLTSSLAGRSGNNATNLANSAISNKSTPSIPLMTADEAIDRTLVELTVEQTASNLIIKDLNPFCVYRLRLAAINKIGLGEFSDWIRAKTEEAAPSGSALKMSALATGPNSIKLTWSPPERRTWNGQLTRFQIAYRPLDSTFELQKTIEWSPPTLIQSIILSAANNKSNSAPSQKSSSDPVKTSSPAELKQHLNQLLALQQQELVAHLTNLQRSTTYLIWIQAINSRGAGPQSHAISVKTLDDVPPSAPALRIQSSSSNSITIGWSMLSNFVSAANQYSLFYRRVPPPPSTGTNSQYFAQVRTSNFSNASQQLQLFNEPGQFIERTISSQQLLLTTNQQQQHQSFESDLDFYSGTNNGQRKFGPVNQFNQQINKNQHHQQFVYTLEPLDCGTAYELYMTTRNSVGKSEPSAIVSARTSGEPPLAPQNKNNLFTKIGAQDVLLNLASWSTGGCPITHVSLRYKHLPIGSPTVQSLNSSSALSSSAASSLAMQAGPNFSLAWPVSVSVPSNLLDIINQQDKPNQSAQTRGPSIYSGFHLNRLALPTSAHLLANDPVTISEAQFALKNLDPSTGYELEISAHNAAGHTTAQYEFVTAGLNGSRSGYTRREGVFRLDQRGQRIESMNRDGELQVVAPSSTYAADNQLNLFHVTGAGSGSGSGGGSSASVPSQLAPLVLTLMCFICLIVGTSFCYYRLADSWKHRGANQRRDSVLDDTMRSVCGTESQFGGAANSAAPSNSKSLLNHNWSRSNGTKNQLRGSQYGSHARQHAELIEDQATPSSTSGGSPPIINAADSTDQRLYQQHFCTHEPNHLVSSATLNPKMSSFSQSVSMKDFNLVPPLGSAAAATLNFSARAQRAQTDLAKIGASATMARGRLFDQQNQHQQTRSAYAPPNGDRTCSALYGTGCNKHNIGATCDQGYCSNEFKNAHHQLINETSWTINGANQQEAATTYAIPAGSYQDQHFDNQMGVAGAGQQCAADNYGSTNQQGNIDVCIQHLMSHQQQYSAIVNQQQQQQKLDLSNNNRCGLYGNEFEINGNQNMLLQQQHPKLVPGNTFGPPQSIIESSSGSSGIGADLPNNSHPLDCVSNNGLGSDNQATLSSSFSDTNDQLTGHQHHHQLEHQTSFNSNQNHHQNQQQVQLDSAN